MGWILGYVLLYIERDADPNLPSFALKEASKRPGPNDGRFGVQFGDTGPNLTSFSTGALKEASRKTPGTKRQ